MLSATVDIGEECDWFNDEKERRSRDENLLPLFLWDNWLLDWFDMSATYLTLLNALCFSISICKCQHASRLYALPLHPSCQSQSLSKLHALNPFHLPSSSTSHHDHHASSTSTLPQSLQ